MKLNSKPENQILTRLQQLYDSSKTSGVAFPKKPPQDHNTSPLVRRRSNNPNSNRTIESSSDTSFYEKYSKIWLKPSYSQSSIKYFALTFSKLRQKFMGVTFRELSAVPSDPLAFTRCPKCDHVGLSLLTTSTQGNLSPRFLDKVKKMLPSKARTYKLTASCAPTDYEKVSREDSPGPKRGSGKNSLVMYSEDQIFSPERKVPLADISEIQPNPYFLSSLSSPEHFQRSVREYRICKPKNEVSFEISRDSGDFFREDLAINNMPKQFIPKLNFNGTVINKTEDGGVREILMFLQRIMNKRIEDAFEQIKGYEPEPSFALSEKSKSQIVSNLYQDRNANYGLQNIQKRMLSNSKKTAFKILNSRLEKFIFRRKMQGFYCISEILYR